VARRRNAVRWSGCYLSRANRYESTALKAVWSSLTAGGGVRVISRAHPNAHTEEDQMWCRTHSLSSLLFVVLLDLLDLVLEVLILGRQLGISTEQLLVLFCASTK